MVKDAQVDARGNHRKPAIVVHGDCALVGGVGILLFALLAGADDIDRSMVHADPLGDNAPGKVEASIQLAQVGRAGMQLVHLLSAEGVGGKGKGDATLFAEDRRREAAITVMSCDRVRLATILPVESQDAWNEL